MVVDNTVTQLELLQGIPYIILVENREYGYGRLCCDMVKSASHENWRVKGAIELRGGNFYLVTVFNRVWQIFDIPALNQYVTK